MRTLFITLLISALLSSTVFAAPPRITTKILEVQNWDGQFYFKIENPSLINPAPCTRGHEWVVADRTSMDPLLLRARYDDTSITVAFSQTQCGEGGFLLVRAVIL